MAMVKFISPEGVEHEVEETSPAAMIMRREGFRQAVESGESGESSESGESVESSESGGADEKKAKKAK